MTPHNVAVSPTRWPTGQRVLYRSYPATVLTPPNEMTCDRWAWILTDLDRDFGRPPITVDADDLTCLR